MKQSILFKLIGAATIMACGLASAIAEGSAKAAVDGKPTVAVFDFEVRPATAEVEGLARELPESMVEAIIASGALRPVEREALMKVLAEQELALSGLVDQATAARVGRLLGARYILLGSATIAAGQMRINCRLVSVETAEIAWAGSARGSLDDVYAIEEDIATALAKGLGQ